MEFRLEIGSWIISQRTEYSKFQLIDKKTGENITRENDEILQTILNDYQKQISNPRQYFEIEDGVLKRFKTECAKALQYIFIPKGIKEIGEFAFEESNIYEVSLPETLERISNGAFQNCNFLNTINIPNSVTSMGDAVFHGCSSLVDVKLSSSLKNISRYLFYDCKSLKKVNLPDSIYSIMSYSFLGCSKLEHVRLPEQCRILDHAVFSGCEKLSEINLPNSLETIGTGCFMSCRSLKEVTIPNSVNQLSSQVFTGCTSLENIKLPETLLSLNEELFAGCTNLKSVVIPDSVATLGKNIFLNTKNIENINMPKDFKNISVPVFASSSIKSLTINHNIEYPKDISCPPFSRKERQYSLNDTDLLTKSNIDKLIISNNVEFIDPRLFRFCGYKITSIDYLGTKEEFENFRKNNNQLFDKLSELKVLNYECEIENEIEKHEFMRD